jgi:hypothetical protein
MLIYIALLLGMREKASKTILQIAYQRLRRRKEKVSNNKYVALCNFLQVSR